MDEHEEDNWCSQECLVNNLAWAYGGNKPGLSNPKTLEGGTTYIHIHTLYIHTDMDPFTHILCLPFTFSCQTTFISGSSEIMNCNLSVSPFLDYIHCTTMSDVVLHIQDAMVVTLHMN